IIDTTEEALRDNSPTGMAVRPPRPVSSLHKREALHASSLRRRLTPDLYVGASCQLPID
ncbi:hypothetical protein GW17_00047807, partial [Ensete ventricosum]